MRSLVLSFCTFFTFIGFANHAAAQNMGGIPNTDYNQFCTETKQADGRYPNWKVCSKTEQVPAENAAILVHLKDKIADIFGAIQANSNRIQESNSTIQSHATRMDSLSNLTNEENLRRIIREEIRKELDARNLR